MANGQSEAWKDKQYTMANKKDNTNNDPQNTIQEAKNYANKNWRSTQLLWKDIQFVPH
jgi:hypothetical protein